ncbi:MAG: carboxypeptidase regulatory-like domain-containing protein, partial [Thermoplasmata archaeon]|nr:carboxypeptidase regulatory-like domain-containing protein [Thermoplasmata archaeon]
EMILTVLEVATTGTVTGTVLDENGIPLAGVSVYIEEYPSIEAITDSLGRYTLENIPQGEQTIVFFKDGYNRDTSTITVVVGANPPINIEMVKASNLGGVILLILIIAIIAIVAFMLVKRKKKSESVIDEIFLMTSDGRLIKHFTRRLKPDMDQDILSGMLVAVQDFIKDSFRGEEGGLEEMRFGRFQIILSRGDFIVIAALVLGDDPRPFKPQVDKCLADIEKKFADKLDDWDGDVDSLTGTYRYIMNLIDGKYG